MSSESPSYALAVLAGGVGLGLLVGLPLAWAMGRAAERYAPRRAQSARVVAGSALLLAGALFWHRAVGVFLLAALLVGLGVGFLVDAARRAR